MDIQKNNIHGIRMTATIKVCSRTSFAEQESTDRIGLLVGLTFGKSGPTAVRGSPVQEALMNFSACHCVSKHWFFSEFERNTNLSEGEKKLARNYRDLVANFIRNGNPNQPNETKFLPFNESHEIIHIQLCLHLKTIDSDN